jgi:phage terminase large subunit
MNYRDNPWFPAVLEAERAELWAKAQNSARKMEEYRWIWEGQCKSSVEGAIFSEEMALATAQGRITSVPYQKGIPVDTFWDLGRSDQTAIWFIQHLHVRRHAINFYENTGYGVEHYLSVLQDLAEEHGYVYGTHYLPHDADNFTLGMPRPITSQIRGEGGLRRVQVVKRPPRKIVGITAARTVMNITYFDRELCDAKLHHLRRYHYNISPQGVRTNEPVHDEHSNAADALQTFGLADKPPRGGAKMPASLPPAIETPTGQGWMR